MNAARKEKRNEWAHANGPAIRIKGSVIGAANGKVMIIKQLLTSFAKHNRIDYALLRTECRTQSAACLIFIHRHRHRQIEKKLLLRRRAQNQKVNGRRSDITCCFFFLFVFKT